MTPSPRATRAVRMFAAVRKRNGEILAVREYEENVLAAVAPMNIPSREWRIVPVTVAPEWNAEPPIAKETADTINALRDALREAMDALRPFGKDPPTPSYEVKDYDAVRTAIARATPLLDGTDATAGVVQEPRP